MEMTTSRFNSNEEIVYNKYYFSLGERARSNNHSLSKNPCVVGSWGYKSFIAGWSDRDMILKEREENESTN